MLDDTFRSGNTFSAALTGVQSDVTESTECGGGQTVWCCDNDWSPAAMVFFTDVSLSAKYLPSDVARRSVSALSNQFRR